MAESLPTTRQPVKSFFATCASSRLYSRLVGMNKLLERALTLQKRDRAIVRAARKKSLAEIARQHGLTRERVRQIVQSAAAGG